MHLNWFFYVSLIENRTRVIANQCVRKQSQDFTYQLEWSINIIKVLSRRFQQCLGPFTMFLVKGSSEMRILRHLSNHLFRSSLSRKYISYEGLFIFPNIQTLLYISKMQKKLTKIFCLLDNSVWIVSVRLTLLRTEYLSLAVNVLTNIR